MKFADHEQVDQGAEVFEVTNLWLNRKSSLFLWRYRKIYLPAFINSR
jgi:hypothetical protein